MKKTTKTALWAAGIATATAAVIGVAYHYSIKELMKIALDREESKTLKKSKEKLTGSSAEMSEIIGRVMQASEKLKASDCETVEITADDGIRLIGHYHAGHNPRRVIVAMHGWRSG